MLEKYWVGGFFFGIWTYKRGAPTKYNGKWFILDGLALHISAKPQVQNNIVFIFCCCFSRPTVHQGSPRATPATRQAKVGSIQEVQHQVKSLLPDTLRRFFSSAKYELTKNPLTHSFPRPRLVPSLQCLPILVRVDPRTEEFKVGYFLFTFYARNQANKGCLGVRTNLELSGLPRILPRRSCEECKESFFLLHRFLYFILYFILFFV